MSVRGMFAGLALAAIALTAPSAARAQASLAPGQSAQGELAAGDSQLQSGEFYDAFTVQGRAGQRLVIRMRSTAFDTYVFIRGPGDFSADNDDDGSGGTDSLLEVRLPADGVYRIAATSYAPGETGRYALEIVEGSVETADATRGGEIAIGQTVRGALSAADERISTGEYVDTWTLTGRRGQTLTISMESTDLDAYLMVRGPGDLAEDNDDDPAARGSTNARLTVTLPASGQMRIRPTSYRPGETGAYVLTVAEGEAADGAPQAFAADESGVLRVGAAVSGDLRQGDGQLQQGEYYDAYTLRGRRGQQLEITMQSGAFDTYVAIVGPDEFGAYNDDDVDAGGTDSRMLVTLPRDGDYTVVATSYAGGETGAYQLRVAETTAVAPGQGIAAAADSIAVGREQRGSLAQGDATLRSGEFTDSYRFRGRAGQRLTVEMASGDFDTYLILVAPSGVQEENDDAPGGGGTNSSLETVLAEDGDYTIIATSYQPGETGAYTLRVAPSTSRPSAASPARSGRVFAVMVGVSDYQGTANNLAYTDEDAVKMAEALNRAGVLADQSIVLTNAQATVANVRAAFQRVAAAAGPDDAFLFFFSGHGMQERTSATPDEPDAREESIVMVDGVITDNQMAEMFRTVNAGVSLIALDSCFSGGFARDVVAVPGVMGLFSSEEDLTSAVADKFQAGGYLSLFLRTGLSGEADEDRNRVVTAGELSVYLRRQFVEHASNVPSETIEGQRNYQYLVVDRGGVRVDDQLLALQR